MDDELDDGFDSKPDRPGSRKGSADEGGKGKEAEGSVGDDDSSRAKGSRNFRNPRKGLRRRNQITSFRVILWGRGEDNFRKEKHACRTTCVQHLFDALPTWCWLTEARLHAIDLPSITRCF